MQYKVLSIFYYLGFIKIYKKSEQSSSAFTKS